jgi:hypothetical protein
MRCFPLFKQSSDDKTLGTILWSGKYVDYGSFDESLNYNISDSEKKEISFSLSMKMSAVAQRHVIADGTIVNVRISVHGDEYSKSSYTEIEYDVYGSKFSIRFAADLKLLSFFINGTDFTKSAFEFYRLFKSYSIMPILYSGGSRSSEAIYASLAKEIKKYVHHRTSDEKIRIIARSIKFSDEEGIKKSLSNKALVGDFAAQKIATWPSGSSKLKTIKDQIVFCNIERILDQITDNFRAYFASLRYITPLRAAADRYYRIQNTSIEELHPNGSNLAMFLHAKKESEIDEINGWLKSNIGFSIRVISSHGHASIFIIDGEGGQKTNIADTGFGISQILPVLIQIWQLSKRRVRQMYAMKVPTTIIIEQPELHLHPRMQSRVGEIFCKAIQLARESEIDVRIIIETHSKDIIEAVGRCVENTTLTKDDVAIYIVDKSDSINTLKSSFDDGGFLTQWPYGFFDGE